MLSFLKKDKQLEAAESLYQTAVDQSREPYFYMRLGVPDSLDGRFEMLSLHVFLLMNALKQGPEETAEARKDMSQKLFDTMFRNLDDTLRQMGVGDLSVAKKIRKMAEAFYGRAGAYGEALAARDNDTNDRTTLVLALHRNVYGDDTATPSDAATLLSDYVQEAVDALKDQPETRLRGGIAKFPAVEVSV